MRNLYASVAALALTAGAVVYGIPAQAQESADVQVEGEPGTQSGDQPVEAGQKVMDIEGQPGTQSGEEPSEVAQETEIEVQPGTQSGEPATTAAQQAPGVEGEPGTQSGEVAAEAAEPGDQAEGQAGTQSGDAVAPEEGQQAGAETGQQPDQLIATVGDREIRQSDVVEAIEALPPQVRQTPPQMLFPAVVDQLITRGLIVERARAENLHEDPEVIAMIEPGAEALEEQALVDVWLRREIGERVTGEDVEKTIEALRATNPDLTATPDLVPQVTQALQVKAMEDISAELRQDAEITFYGPGGEPVDTEAQVGAGAEQGMAPGSEPALGTDEGTGTAAPTEQGEAPASEPALGDEQAPAE